MGYSSDSERPAKRLKPDQPSHQQPLVHKPGSWSSAATLPMAPDTAFSSWPSQPDPSSPAFSVHSSSLDPGWAWDPTSFEAPTTQVYRFLPVEPRASRRPDESTSTTAPPAKEPIEPAVSNPANTILPQSTASSDVTWTSNPGGAQINPEDGGKSDDNMTVAKSQIQSPFADCLGTFGTFAPLEFRRPEGGFVNGYIKFRWASMSPRPVNMAQPVPFSEDSVTWSRLPPSVIGGFAGQSPGAVTVSPSLPASQSPGIAGFVMADASPERFSMAPDWNASFPASAALSPAQLTRPADHSMAVVHQSAQPRMVPPQFGYQAKMELKMDRRLWQFYIHNWCPGRSILQHTNLWLKDFANMHEHEGVRCAMQSLAGVYIYDYVPQPHVRNRINELFGKAEARLTTLLNDPDITQGDKVDELITIASLLSMQDIILTERRRQKPHMPRWLEGFLRSEIALEMTDPGTRFWQKSNVQLKSLRISHSIIVGRGIILAQPLMPLPAPKDFDTRREAARFGWLLYGTERDMYEIHGGCGFSKKLLHILSQVTYWAARLLQDEESPIAPMTTGYLFKELTEMRQWSSESRTWEDAKYGPQIVNWARVLGDGDLIKGSAAMTDVTAEAWRIAAITYLQCRAMRLPRNHPEVVSNLTDLVHCIRVMPTSGNHFTAQAPLFPVFLLGLVAVTDEHKAAAQHWFEQVIQTPVRSSVPPLYEVLQRIWSWIDDEIPITREEPNSAMGKRYPWWERLVDLVNEREQETLCLT